MWWEGLITSVLGKNPTLSVLALLSIAAIVWALMSGLLTPKWITKALLSSRDLQVNQANLRAEDYKRLYELEAAARDAAQRQVTELLVVGRTAERVLNALPSPGGDSR